MISNSKNLIEEKIKLFLLKKGKASSSEIAKQINHNRITVTKYLELMKAHDILECEDIAQAKLWSISNKINKKKILVVDDEPHIVQLVKLSLSSPNIEIIEAFSGFDALEKVKQHSPDLIILDLMMPGLNGYEVCRKLKSEAIFQHIPIIILSAKNELEDKIKGSNAGAEDYITKPFDPIEFEARINSMLFSFDKEIEINPLTKLPGKTALISYLSDIKEKKVFIYKIKLFGLNFFNKKIGFKRGNELLIVLSRILNEKAIQSDNSRIFHLINDVFIVITSQKEFINEISSSFENILPLMCNNQNIKTKIKIEIEIINKSIGFKSLNRIIKKIEKVD